MQSNSGYLHHLSSQAKYSLCQKMASWGFSIQWFSSGKTISLDGTPIICAALNAAIPWSTGTRKSIPPWVTRRGVCQLVTSLWGELA